MRCGLCVSVCTNVPGSVHVRALNVRDPDPRPDEVNPSWDLIRDVDTRTGPQEILVYIERIEQARFSEIS